MEAGSPEALQAFLLTKLHTLGPADKAQVCLLAWLRSCRLEACHASPVCLEHPQQGMACSSVL